MPNSNSDSKTPIGLLGTGLMGSAIAQRLQALGQPLQVYNRTLAKTQPLADLGISVAESLEVLLDQAEILLLMLSDAAAIETTLLVEPQRSRLLGKTVIQMGTIAPDQSLAIASQVTAAGGQYLEAPVLGSIPEARSGQLILMVGSSPEQFAQVQPLLQNLGPAPRSIGPVGSAMALKLALNQLIAAETSAFALSLRLVQAQNVPVEAFMDILRDSALYAPTFDKKLSRMVDHQYANPNFPTKHLLKDVRLFLQAAQGAGLQAESLAGIETLLERAIAQDLGDQDYSALADAI